MEAHLARPYTMRRVVCVGEEESRSMDGRRGVKKQRRTDVAAGRHEALTSNELDARARPSKLPCPTPTRANMPQRHASNGDPRI